MLSFLAAKFEFEIRLFLVVDVVFRAYNNTGEKVL